MVRGIGVKNCLRSWAGITTDATAQSAHYDIGDVALRKVRPIDECLLRHDSLSVGA